ncbi:hypothetical protein PIB30_098882 [Stylosanthes scabra]|uniref:Uncharacterized protein n=1 Tax=Stylosanthes scabra TaxID=79078 RepID=A0ABU6UWB9_9FABA|nr:hypothetical protein [Stylosanthes scabra]
MIPLQILPTSSNIILKKGAIINLLVGSHLSINKLSLGSFIPTVSPRTAKIPDTSLHIIVSRGINAVQVEKEEDEIEDEYDENDWLYELLKKLANSNDEEDEESEDGSKEEDEDESTEEGSEDKFVEEGDQTEEEAREEDRDKGNIFFINNLFKKKRNEEKVPIKCGDPDPCLVTCKI